MIMATRTIFEDQDNNEMECLLNDEGKVFISVGKREEDIAYRGFITLDKQDIRQLIEILTECENEMTN